MAELQGTSQFVGNKPDGPPYRICRSDAWTAGDAERARDLLSDADRVVAANDQLFATSGRAVNVIYMRHELGNRRLRRADHMGCDDTTGGQSELERPFATPRGYPLCLRPS